MVRSQGSIFGRDVGLPCRTCPFFHRYRAAVTHTSILNIKLSSRKCYIKTEVIIFFGHLFFFFLMQQSLTRIHREIFSMLKTATASKSSLAHQDLSCELSHGLANSAIPTVFPRILGLQGSGAHFPSQRVSMGESTKDVALPQRGTLALHLLKYLGCCCSSIAQSCPTLCDPMDCSMPGLLVLHHVPELA